jgi:Rieske Fe-S protein
MNRSRRAFWVRSCRLHGGAAAGVLCRQPALAAAGGAAEIMTLPVVRGTVKDNTIMVAIESTPLAVVGGCARVVSNAGSFLVARTAAQECAVVTAVCSHTGCVIEDVDGAEYVCNCHGSRFDRSGTVLVGPAEFPLVGYDATVSDAVLTITL